MSASAPEVVDGFRQRGTSVSRLECFCDCVFAFALTLLVVSLEVPKSYGEMMAAMRGFFAFAMTFATLATVWNRHYVFCRQYGLEDGVVRLLSLLLLFVVLAYVYPLKFLATLFVNGVLGFDSASLAGMKMKGSELAQLFTLYGAGFAAVSFVMLLFYAHAYRLRKKLDLNEIELLDTRWTMIEQGWTLTIPAISIVLANTLPPHMLGIAGFAYFGLGLVGWGVGSMHGKRKRLLMKAAS